MPTRLRNVVAVWLRRLVTALLGAKPTPADEGDVGPIVVEPCPEPIQEPQSRKNMKASDVYQAVQDTQEAVADSADGIVVAQHALDTAEADHARNQKQAAIAKAVAVKTFAEAPLYIPESNTLVYVKDGDLKTSTPSLPDDEVPHVEVDVDGDGRPDNPPPPPPVE